MIDSDRTGKNCYPQVFLENVNMLLKKKRFLNILLTIQKFLLILIEKILMSILKEEHSNEQISDEKNSDEKNPDEENSGEENLKKMLI